MLSIRSQRTKINSCEDCWGNKVKVLTYSCNIGAEVGEIKLLELFQIIIITGEEQKAIRT